MSSSQRILVTAALPYANGDLHLGHMAGAYLPADIYVRYQRLQQREVLFICGSDENGVAITVSAEKEGVSPQVVVDRYHEANRRAFERFGMSFDNYSRTSLPSTTRWPPNSSPSCTGRASCARNGNSSSMMRRPAAFCRTVMWRGCARSAPPRTPAGTSASVAVHT